MTRKMKNEMFYGFENTFESLDNLKQAMIDYIHYHNNFRITVKGKGGILNYPVLRGSL